MKKNTDKNPESTMTMLLGGANSAATDPIVPEIMPPVISTVPDNLGIEDISSDSATAIDDQQEPKKRGPKPKAEKAMRCTYMVNTSNVDKIDAVNSITRKPIKDIVNEALDEYFGKNAELVDYCVQERGRLAKAIKKRFN